ncbi:hypothetical protein SAMN06265337_3931 [Hymenobacter gelipurpurascens]|uniref:SpoIIAA-like n=1 Tax=Hymenobacter gelipurpurascens TaxID=89968 RepID=A0A212UGG1_9BACT|nr:hypothetical protein SAMN06265337_3931 [Hymenobacter gelipurpurascens]
MVGVFGSLCVQVAPQGQLLRWKWQDAASYESFQQSFELIVAASRDHSVTQWLADLSTMSPLGINEQQWLSENWLVQFAALGIHRIALIEPNSLHNQLVIESVLADGRRYTHADIQFFADVPAALDWLTMSDAGVIETLEQEWQAVLAG